MRHEETSSSSDENYDNDDVEAMPRDDDVEAMPRDDDVEAMPRDFDIERLIDAFIREADRE